MNVTCVTQKFICSFFENDIEIDDESKFIGCTIVKKFQTQFEDHHNEINPWELIHMTKLDFKLCFCVYIYMDDIRYDLFATLVELNYTDTMTNLLTNIFEPLNIETPFDYSDNKFIFTFEPSEFRIPNKKPVYLKRVEMEMYGGNITIDNDDPWAISEIIPEFLYLGNVDGAADIENLKRLGIKYVLNMTSESKSTCDYNPPAGLFECLRISIDDSPNVRISDYFNTTHKFINKARSEGVGVLVHCYAGVSRSASIVISYLMKTQGLSFNDARIIVRNLRPIINPNEGFVNCLIKYEQR